MKKVNYFFNLDYNEVYEEINKPYSNNEKGIILALTTSNQEILKNSYKQRQNKEIFNKTKILKEFESENKKIRSKDTINPEIYFDSILNECIVDAVNEIINQEMY